MPTGNLTRQHGCGSQPSAVTWTWTLKHSGVLSRAIVATAVIARVPPRIISFEYGDNLADLPRAGRYLKKLAGYY